MHPLCGPGAEVDGRYRIVRHLSSGGMGHVYEAEDLTLGRRVALKVLASALQTSEVAQGRFAAEARTAAMVRHPGVVRVYDIGGDGTLDYIAMELLEGEDLHARLLRDGPLPAAFVLELARSLMHALVAMHAAGVVHRDLKPRNIFLAREEGREVVKILDFGVARGGLHGAEVQTGTGEILGTLQYMAPEQLRGARNADARSDLWSVGVILYEALTGVRPFQGEFAPALILSIASETPAKLSSLRPSAPRVLERLVERALQRNPLKRFQSATELLAELDSIDEVALQQVAPPRSARILRKTYSMRAAGSVVACAAMLCGVVGWTVSTQDNALRSDVRVEEATRARTFVGSYAMLGPDAVSAPSDLAGTCSLDTGGPAACASAIASEPAQPRQTLRAKVRLSAAKRRRPGQVEAELLQQERLEAPGATTSAPEPPGAPQDDALPSPAALIRRSEFAY